MGAFPSLLRSAKFGLFGTLYLCQKKAHYPATLTVVGMLIKWLQLVAFLVEHYANPAVDLRWSPAIGPLRTVSGVTSITFYYPLMSPDAFLAVYFVGFVFVLLFLGLMLYGASSFSHGEVAFLWPLRLLRAIGSVSATILFIPLLTLLLSAWSCGSEEVHHWTDAGFTCYSPAHLSLCIVSTLLAAVFFGLSALFSVTMIDPHPLSPALAAKSSGNVDLLLLVLKTVLVVIGHVGVDTLASPWVLIAVNGLAAAAWLGVLLAFVPYRSEGMQQFVGACATAYLYAAICAALTLVPGFDAAIMLYCGLPFAALAGVAVTDWNRAFILNADVGALRSPYDYDHRVQAVLRDALAAAFKGGALGGSGGGGIGGDRHSGGAGRAGGSQDGGSDGGSLLPPDSASIGGGSGGAGDAAAFVAGGTPATVKSPHPHAGKAGGTAGVGGVGSGGAALFSPYSVATSKHGGGGGGGGAHLPFGGRLVLGPSCGGDGSGVSDGSDFCDAPGARGQGAHADRGDQDALAAAAFRVLDADQRAEVARARLPPAVLKHIESLYAAATARFPSSAVLHAMQARFYATFRDDHDGKRQTAVHYMQATRLAPSLWVQFQAFCWRRVQDSEQAGSGELPVMKRIQFDKHLSDARRASVAAVNNLILIYTELQEARPDTGRLQDLASAFAKASRTAELGYSASLSINPQSLSALRLSSQFHAVCLNHKDKALALAAEADRLEEARSKEATAGQSTFSFKLWAEVPSSDVMAEAGILTIGSTSRDLGVIASTSAAVCRSFGFSRNQLERRSLSVLMPSPVGDIFMSRLAAFAAGDSSVRLSDTIRSVFGRHKSGAIFPMYVLIRESLDHGGGGGGSDGEERHGGHLHGGGGSSSALMALIRPVQAAESFILADGRFNVVAADGRSLALLLNTDAASLATGDFNLAECIERFDEVCEDLQRPAGALITFCLGGARAAAAAAAAASGHAHRHHGGGGSGGDVALGPPHKGRTRRGAVGGSDGDDDGDGGGARLSYADADGHESAGGGLEEPRRSQSFRTAAAGATMYRLRARLQLVNHQPTPVAVLAWRLGSSSVSRSSPPGAGSTGGRRSTVRRDSLTLAPVARLRRRRAGGSSEGAGGGGGGGGASGSAEPGLTGVRGRGADGGGRSLPSVPSGVRFVEEAALLHTPPSRAAARNPRHHAVAAEGVTGVADSPVPSTVSDGTSSARRIVSAASSSLGLHGSDQSLLQAVVRIENDSGAENVEDDDASDGSVDSASPVRSPAGGPKMSAAPYTTTSTPTRDAGRGGMSDTVPSDRDRRSYAAARYAADVNPPQPMPSSRAGSGASAPPPALGAVSRLPSFTFDADAPPARTSREDDERSEASSRSSRTSATRFSTKTLNRFRRVMDLRNKRPSGVITSRLLAGTFVLLVLCTALAIAATVVVDSSISSFQNNLEFLSLVGANAAALLSIHHIAVVHALWLRGWRQSTPEYEASLLDIVGDYAAQYQANHVRLLEMIASDPRSGAVAALVSGENTAVIDFHEASTRRAADFDDAAVRRMLSAGSSQWARTVGPEIIVSDRKPTSLTKLGFWWCEAAAQYSALALNASTISNVFARTLIENGRHGAPAVTIHRAFVLKAYELAAAAAQLINSTALWIFVSMGPVLGVVLVLLMTPLLVSIHNAKGDLILCLLDLPTLVVARLRLQAIRRRREIRAGKDDDEAGDDSEDEQEFLAAGGGGGGGGAGGSGMGGVGGMGDDGDEMDVDWAKIIQLDALMAARTARSNAARHGGGGGGGGSGTSAVTGGASAGGGKGDRRSSASFAAGQLHGMPASGSSASSSIGGGGGNGRRSSLRSQPDTTLLTPESAALRGPPKPWWRRALSTLTAGAGAGAAAEPHRRPHKRSVRSALGLLLFYGPIAYCFFLFMALYLWTSSVGNTLSALSLQTTLSVFRDIALRQTYSSVGYLVGFGTGFPSELSLQYEASMNVLAELQYVTDVLSYSDTSSLRELIVSRDSSAAAGASDDVPLANALGVPAGKEAVAVPGLTPAQQAEVKAISFGNVCELLRDTNHGYEDTGVPLDFAECSSYHNGLAKNGVTSLVSDAVLHARRMISRRSLAYVPLNSTTGQGRRYSVSIEDSIDNGHEAVPLNGSVPEEVLRSSAQAWAAFANMTATTIMVSDYSIFEELRGDDFIKLRKDKQLAMPLLQRVTRIYLDASSAVIADFRSGVRIFVAVAVCLYVVITLLVYLPAVHALELDIHQKRSLLLLLPIEVVSCTPSIETLIRKILAEADVAAGSTAAGGHDSAVANALSGAARRDSRVTAGGGEDQLQQQQQQQGGDAATALSIPNGGAAASSSTSDAGGGGRGAASTAAHKAR